MAAAGPFSVVLGSECSGRIFEQLGPSGSAVLSAASRVAADSPHTEAYWRALCRRRLLFRRELAAQGEPRLHGQVWREAAVQRTVQHDVQIAAHDADVELELDGDAQGIDRGAGASQVPSPDALGHWRSRFARLYGQECARELRRAKLREALETRGLTLRDDSVMCSRYIRDGAIAVQGGLAQVVDIMAEMDFFFRETLYGWQRRAVAEELEDRAERDARDAFAAGEDEAINPARYLEDLSTAEISDLAKMRALRSFVTEMHAEHEALNPEELLQFTLALTPRTLHAQLTRLHEMCVEGRGGSVPADSALQQFGAIPGGEEAATRRARLRVVAARESPLEIRMAEHIEALRIFAARNTAESDILTFPPALSSEERAFLHGHAEVLGLRHESQGFGSERALVVRAYAGVIQDGI